MDGSTRGSELRSPGQRAGLSRAVVLAEARRLVADVGVEGLTMRALASRLGVVPNTLYSHVADKSSLLDALLDEILADVETTDLRSMSWRDGLATLMGRSRAVLLVHADLLPHFLARPTRGANAIRLGEATLELLERADVRGDEAVEALRILLVYVFGYVALEAPRRADPEPEARRAISVGVFVAAREQARVARSADALTSPMSDATFEIGLGWLLDGVSAAARPDTGGSG